MRRWVISGSGGLLLLLAVVPAAFALLTPVGVRTTPAREIHPAASGSWIAWAQNRPGHPNSFDAYVQDGANPRVKVNPTGVAFPGGFDGAVFAYQRIVPTARRLHGDSNIRLYDVAAQTRPALPAGVNTINWEYSPTLSNQWLLFGRVGNGNDRILLHNLVTHERRELDSGGGSGNNPGILRTAGRDVMPGQVNGDFAVWQGLVTAHYGLSTTSVVRRYKISTDTRRALPLPTGKWQYAPSAASDGRVFYVRSNDACISAHRYTCLSISCGKQVVLREWAPAPADIDTALVALPPGYDTSRTYFDESTSTFYYDQYNCATGGSNIYEIVIP